ncbi:MAG: hypothetical protein HY303_18530 [Candidatus Wallbacteria bacterium]|nr:hypothetical protein [Candidatus Wallbacteria bacterium]
MSYATSMEEGARAQRQVAWLAREVDEEASAILRRYLSAGVPLAEAAALTLPQVQSKPGCEQQPESPAPFYRMHGVRKALGLPCRHRRFEACLELLRALASGSIPSDQLLAELPFHLRLLSQGASLGSPGASGAAELVLRVETGCRMARQHESTLTAQPKISAAILVGLPLSLILILGCISPEFLATSLPSEPNAWMAAGGSIAVVLAASLWLGGRFGRRLRQLQRESEAAAALVLFLPLSEDLPGAVTRAVQFLGERGPGARWLRAMLEKPQSGVPALFRSLAALAAQGLQMQELASWLQGRIDAQAKELVPQATLSSATLTPALLVVASAFLLAMVLWLIWPGFRWCL